METIIAIVTAGIALITSIATFSYNVMKSRKDRIQKVILDNRIKYLNEIRDGFTNFIGLCNIKSINLAKNNPDIMKIFADRLFVGYGKIKTFIKPFYQIDKELLASLDLLYESILSRLCDKDDTDIDALRNSFAEKYLTYDWAYWKYIQRQKDGVYLDSDKAFDVVYNDFVQSIKKTGATIDSLSDRD